MKRYFFDIIFMVIFTGNLNAQSAEKKSDISEIRKNKYQVELGFSSVQNIYNNTAAATIMFKKKFSTGDLVDVKSIKFLRTYFTVNSNFNISNDTFPRRRYNFDLLKKVDLTLGVGMEKQFQNRRFVHYLGCDIFSNYYDGGQAQRYTYFNTLNYSVLYEYEKKIDTGIIPFIGMKYYITDQFCFGVETGFSISYYRSKNRDVYYTYEYLNGQEIYTQTSYTPFIESGIKSIYLGMRFITVGYTFK